MAFRALLFSKSIETNAAITAACTVAGIRAEGCSDIFTAIEKGKTRAFSCVIVDWADQPEANFLLKRARESVPNRETVAVAIVDHDPKPAELRDNRLDFLIYRPIAPDAASAVLAAACEKMQPMSSEDAREAFEENRDASTKSAASTPSVALSVPEPADTDTSGSYQEGTAAEEYIDSAIHYESNSRGGGHAIGFRGVCAAALVLAAIFSSGSRAKSLHISRGPRKEDSVLSRNL